MQSTGQSVLVHLSINESISQLNLITPFQGIHEHNEPFEGEVHYMVVRMSVPAISEWENLGSTRSVLCVIMAGKKRQRTAKEPIIAAAGTDLHDKDKHDAS